MLVLWAIVAIGPLGWCAQPRPAALDAYHSAVASIAQYHEREWSTAAAASSCATTKTRREDVSVQRLPVEDAAHHALHADGALLHHWQAAVFVPGAQPEDVVAVLKDYDHHSEIYRPDVIHSQLLRQGGDRYDVLHETLTRSVVNVGLKIESTVEWHRVPPDTFWSYSSTVRVVEMEHPGTARVRERRPEEAKGWLWAMDSWWHIAPEREGACVTYEMIALTRDVPWGWGWLLRRVVERFPADTLTNLLQRTRAAVQARKEQATFRQERSKK
jgi:hypothetical protein